MCLLLVPVEKVEAASKTVCTRDDGKWLFPLSKYYYENCISDWAGCGKVYQRKGKLYGSCLLCGQQHYPCSAHEPSHLKTKKSPNYGLDISTGKTTAKVMSARDGKVYYHNKMDSPRGIYAIVEHPINDKYSYYSLYQHLDSVNSKKYPHGKEVKAGDVIGYTGGSGTSKNSFALHLHFEVFIGEKGGGEQLTKTPVDNSNGKYYSIAYKKTDGISVCAIITNPSVKSPQPKAYQCGCKTSVENKYHRGSITYVFDKAKVGGEKLQQSSSKFPTGTYQVGPKFTGMKEGRVIRTGKTTKTPIIVSLPVGAKVYVKETYTNENVAKVVYKANNTTYTGYMYIADKVGKQKFTKISDKDTTPKAITVAPVVTATTQTSISINKNVSFKWNAVANATKYLVTVRKGSTEVAKKEIAGTTYSHTFTDQTSYTVTVQAKNDAFWSANSNVVTVTANKPVKVTFKDYDGTIISTQTISYGGDAKVSKHSDR